MKSLKPCDLSRAVITSVFFFLIRGKSLFSYNFFRRSGSAEKIKERPKTQRIDFICQGREINQKRNYAKNVCRFVSRWDERVSKRDEKKEELSVGVSEGDEEETHLPKLPVYHIMNKKRQFFPISNLLSLWGKKIIRFIIVRRRETYTDFPKVKTHPFERVFVAVVWSKKGWFFEQREKKWERKRKCNVGKRKNKYVRNEKRKDSKEGKKIFNREREWERGEKKGLLSA